MRNIFRAVVIILAMPAVASALPLKTLDNLQAAFNGESNAHARYLAFANKADAEGYAQAASLFRAAARAEAIHAANHATVIRQLGGEPSADIETPDVKSTRDNLLAAIKGETYERDVMYPEFLKVARAERQTAAIRTFHYAKTAEAEHAALYTASEHNLDSMRAAGVTYYVCTVCGYTTTKINFAKCPSCATPKDRYIAVS
ncbi:MAG TPA: rubrerythrin family protein [Thermoanaerobaculia bacterium]